MKRLLTTPIYYVNDIPHIGHAYSTIISDVIKRYWEMLGDDVFLLTGTDEHGQKIEEAAHKRGIKTIEYANSIAQKFQHVWDAFNIKYDKFIRTTYLEHILSVQKAFEIMLGNGDIYKGEYEGQYCVSCESFFTPIQVLDGIYCPDCGKETRAVKEESYFFKLSKYEEKLLLWYKENAECILPLHKKNEVIKFVESGLQDLSITRTSFEWGIKIPLRLKDDKHIIYVWLDALMNYISALGYGLCYNNAKELLQHKLEQNPTLESKMEYFNHASHVVGKDILRFHAIYWPAFLMSLSLPLPKHIFVHGWWTIDGVKMSKSIGNVVNPLDILAKYPLDIFRYFLLKEVPFGQDGDFSEKALINRNNGELSNDLGNLVNRLIGMSGKYFDYDLICDVQGLGANNVISETQKDSKANFSFSYIDKEYKKQIDSICNKALEFMDNMQPNKYLESIWELLHLANLAITQVAPWKLMKANKTQECLEFLNLIANIIAKSALLLYPVMPETCEKIAICLNLKINSENFRDLILNHNYLNGFKITKIEALFPKIEIDLNKENLASEALDSKSLSNSLSAFKEGGKGLSNTESKLARGIMEKKDSKNSMDSDISYTPLLTQKLATITIQDFQKLDIKVGTILSVEKLPKSKKLLKFRIDLGEEAPRQIISGIAEFYECGSLLGSQVCVLANLKPAKIMGEMSEGMILTCEDSKGLSLLRVESARENGSGVS